MNTIEELQRIDDFFKNLSVEEFDDMLERNGMCDTTIDKSSN